MFSDIVLAATSMLNEAKMQRILLFAHTKEEPQFYFVEGLKGFKLVTSATVVLYFMERLGGTFVHQSNQIGKLTQISTQ